MTKFIILVFLIANSFIYLHSADNENSSLGFYSNYIINYDNAELKKLPNIPNCCPLFTQGLGYGLNLGAFLDFPIKKKLLFRLSFGFSKFQNELKSTEDILINFSSEPIKGEVEHYIKANLRTIDFQTSLYYNIISALNMGIGFGIANLINKSYEQKETLIKPMNRGVFSDTGTRIRNDTTGIINSTNSILPFFSTNFSYDLPLDKSESIIISPNLFFKIPLASYLVHSKWESYTLGLGLSLKFNSDYKPLKIFFDEHYQIDTLHIETDYKITAGFKRGLEEISLDTIDFEQAIVYSKEITRVDTVFEFQEPTLLHIDCDATVLSSNSENFDYKSIVLEKIVMTNMVPILNYIFFDKNDYTIPKRYRKLSKNQISNYNIDSLYNYSTMDIYYDCLNIIAYRLKIKPKTKIIIVGCNADFGKEKNNLTLSNNRADAVKNYFTNVWSISDKRIKIETRNLPDEPSTLTNKEGLAENRRVEILTEDTDILEPVIIKVPKYILPSTVVRFHLDFEKPNDIQDWYLKVYNKSSTFKNFSGGFSSLVDWVIFKKASELKDKIYYQFYVQTKQGEEYFSPKHLLPIKKYDANESKNENVSKIYNYQLILFKYNQADLKKRSLKTLEFIKNEIKNYSTIKITGYTDKLGDENYNKKLSLKRAVNVASELGINNAIINAYGESLNLFDNNLPEGRFYSRTVNIEVTK